MTFNNLATAELILNDDGSIYHLNLLPGEVANNVILVGDPNRATLVANHFDEIELCKTKREFITYTGVIDKKRITVVGTGIGAGNIDIVINELDALVNIDFDSRTIKPSLQQLNIIRLGTTGALSADIPIDSLIISDFACGFDGILHYYRYTYNQHESQLLQQLKMHFAELSTINNSYACQADPSLCQLFNKNYLHGITLTCAGFYGPQNRSLRAPIMQQNFFDKSLSFNYSNLSMTNFEMETAIIYGLSRLLGHASCSINCVMANRATQQMSSNPQLAINHMIEQSLELLCQ